MNSEDVSFSPFLAVVVGCLSALLFALFIVFCKHYYSQIKKKDTFFGFGTNSQKPRNQRNDSTFETNCEYCNCYKDRLYDTQTVCNCGCNSNSNNNSNSLSANDPEIDSNNALIYNSQKHNESLLDTISIEKVNEHLKINLIGQNSLDVASIDEIINDELLEELDKNIAIRLDENDNQSFEIIKQDKLIKQSSVQNDKPIKVILKLHRNLPLKLHSQSIELINEKPSTRKQLTSLRRASLNLVGGLVRQKSFDLEEEESSVCQHTDALVFGANRTRKSRLRRESNRENSKELNGENEELNNRVNKYSKSESSKVSASESNKQIEKRNKIVLNDSLNDKSNENKSIIESTMNDQTIEQDSTQIGLKSNDSSSEENDRQDYQNTDYQGIWNLRATLEAEIEKDLTDSCGDLTELSNLAKQQSIENNEQHEEHDLIKNIVLSSNNSDPKLSKNDSGYKSIERRDYSMDSKTESIYRQFTAGNSVSLSKEFSVGSISNQNISLCSSGSINLDAKNYRNQYTIKEEEDNGQKITFV